MKPRTRNLVGAAAVMMAIALCAPSAHAQQKATVRAGYLTCHVAGGWGFVFGSSRTVKCAYARDKDYTEHYTGSITNVELQFPSVKSTDQDVGARADSERNARRSGPIMTGQRAFAEISGWRDHRLQYDGRREIADIGVELGQRTGGL